MRVNKCIIVVINPWGIITMHTELKQVARTEYNEDFEQVSVKYFVISYNGRVLREVLCNSKDGRRIVSLREHYENQISTSLEMWEH
jgi:hypothetical protein